MAGTRSPVPILYLDESIGFLIPVPSFRWFVPSFRWFRSLVPSFRSFVPYSQIHHTIIADIGADKGIMGNYIVMRYALMVCPHEGTAYLPNDDQLRMDGLEIVIVSNCRQSSIAQL